MTHNFDLVIRNGNIADGTGKKIFQSDIAIADGCIAEVGKVVGKGREEIDASGLLVTPGFVDIHTHYDGQVTWESRTEPSSSHGVTTVVTGNCGVGFAPCRSEDRERLVHLMEGVEDIPEIVMTEGLPWNWESFPEYLDVVASRPHDVDIAAQLPHSCLRVFVMGERGANREPATAEDLAAMERLTEEAMRAGAIGVGTSRTLFHKDSTGAPIPTKDASELELYAIADGMMAAGHGVIEAVFDFGDMEQEFALLRRIAERSGRPISFSLAQTLGDPHAWKRALELLKETRREGLELKAQIMGRATGIVIGLDLSFNPFSLYPSYEALAGLPLKERVAQLRRPEVRAQILSERPGEPTYLLLRFLSQFDRMFPFDNPPNYEPPLETSIAAQAEAQGKRPEEVAYDFLLKDDGRTTLFVPFANYVDGNLDAALTMMKDENTLLGLADGGAHYGVICDAGYPTFMLQYWTRDRSIGEKLSVEAVVKALTSKNAEAMDLRDRGVVAPGYKADLNLIDYDRLTLHAPHVAYDLPAGGRRMKQKADGYVATIVNGVVTYREGNPTGALPGQLIRGPKPTPNAA